MSIYTFFHSASHATHLDNFNLLHSAKEEPVMAALDDNGEVIAFTSMSADSAEPRSELKEQFADYKVAGTAENFTLLVSRGGLTNEGKKFVKKNNLPGTTHSILGCAINLKP